MTTMMVFRPAEEQMLTSINCFSGSAGDIANSNTPIIAGRGVIVLIIHPVLIDQDTHRRAFAILELSVRDRPDESDEAGKSHQQRDGYQENETVHRADRMRRSELPTTIIDDSDIATAATRGVTNPAMAAGTASAL